MAAATEAYPVRSGETNGREPGHLPELGTGKERTGAADAVFAGREILWEWKMSKIQFSPNEVIFFKKKVQTEQTRPNAIYIRHIQELPKDDAHEIRWNGEFWSVSRSHIKTIAEAFTESAARQNAEIEKAKVSNPKEPWSRRESPSAFKRLGAFRPLLQPQAPRN